MNRCAVEDCSFINRARALCKLNFIEHDNRGYCTSFKQDKAYLNWTLRESLYGVLHNKGFDPETELMLNMAPPLYHTPCKSAGEEEKNKCQE